MMMRFCFLMALLYSSLVSAQIDSDLKDNAVSSAIAKTDPEKILKEYNLTSDPLYNDLNYHAGALKVMELNLDVRSLTSTFCISCHDGAFVKAGHTTTNFGNPPDIDRSSIFKFNHPVAFEFTSSLAASKDYLHDPYTTPSGLGRTIAEDLLVDGKVECVTCHNIFFNKDNLGNYEKLNKSNFGSSLCLTCHDR